jgi:hypothetical protein
LAGSHILFYGGRFELIKEIFRKKYKISDEIDDWGYGSNKLVRI